MNSILRVARPWVGCLAVGVGLAGCKVSACPDSQAVDGGKSTTKDNCIQFEPTVEYRGSARTATQAWSSGKNVTVKNRNGKLVILSDSTTTDVQVSGIPFTRDGQSDAEKQSATAHLAAMASPSVAPDAAGNVIVEALGGGTFDGYDLTVHLPSAFDGALKAIGDNGDLQYSGTPSSTGNVLRSNNGDVTAGIGATANVAVTAKTDLGVVVFRGSGWMTPMISADGMSGSASLGTGAGTLDVSSGNGDVVVQLP